MRHVFRRFRSSAPPADRNTDLIAQEEGASLRDPRETDLLLALAFFIAIAFFFLPKTPIFGGTKHWMTAYPVLALVAGRGFDIVASAMHEALPRLQGRLSTVAERSSFTIRPGMRGRACNARVGFEAIFAPSDPRARRR